MPRYNIRFADFATRAPLFELQVEQDTTVGALKAMVGEHLSNIDDLCPMKYFDKWYLEVQVGDRKKMVGIDEGDEGLALAAAGLEDESVVYLEGPMFEEGQAEVGRAIAAVRAQAKAQAAQHALQMQGLMAEMCRRFDAIAAKQQELSDQRSAMAKDQSDVNAKLEFVLSANTDTLEELSSTITAGQLRIDEMGNAMKDMLSGNTEKLQKITEMQPLKQHKAEVDSLLLKHSNRPLKALWEVLIDKANPGIELPMAIIMDPRCGIARRAELADGPMKSKGGFTINDTTNNKDYEFATPLIVAVLAGRNDVVSALLANGADYEATFGTDGLSALHIAAVGNNVGTIELLVNYGADVSKPNKNNSNPLHQAAYYGHAAAIEALVRLGADLTIVNSLGNTPLQTFVKKPVRPHAHLSEAEKERLKALLTPKAS